MGLIKRWSTLGKCPLKSGGILSHRNQSALSDTNSCRNSCKNSMGWGSEHPFFARWLLQLPQLPSWRGGYRGREAKCHGDKEPCDCVPLVDGGIASVHYCCLMLRFYTQSATPGNEVISYTYESIGICHCWYDKSPGVLLDDGAAHGTVWVGFGWMYHGTTGATGTAQRHFVVFLCIFHKRVGLPTWRKCASSWQWW